MKLNKKPLRIAGAFNPVLVEIKRVYEYKDSEYVYSATVNVTMGDNTYTLVREFLNGIARYNLSELIATAFGDKRETVNEDIFIDSLLQVKVNGEVTEYEAGDEPDYEDGYEDGYEDEDEDKPEDEPEDEDRYEDKDGKFTITVIRAVSQQRGQYDMAPLEGKFLTGFKKLYKYKNYPLFVSFLTLDNPDSDETRYTYLNINGKTLYELDNKNKHLTLSVPDGTAGISITPNRITQPLLTDNGDEIQTNLQQTIVISTGVLEQEKINIQQACNPNSLFYIRWINRMGGWDTWMFKNRQFKKSQLTKVETFQAFIEDYREGPAQSEHVLNAEALETIIAGAENLTENEFDNLQLLKYSPLIQQYHKDSCEWSRIYLQKAETEKDTGETRFALEFEFTLPLPKLQF
jgi:hypothetical protein